MAGEQYRWDHECEARCPAAGTETVQVLGRKFVFCAHHARKITGQLAGRPTHSLHQASVSWFSR